MPLRLLVVSDEPGPLLEEARGYLQSHSLPVEYITRTGKPGEQIAACAADCGATLIVMGAFGHTKLRELIVGSVTAQTLHRAACPVLLNR
jgi:nucleotide-binding universal stress UspA family protein